MSHRLKTASCRSSTWLGAKIAATALTLTASATAQQVVISQVYPTGGQVGSPWNRDFVELHNRGSTPVSLSTWSLQIGGGVSWSRQNLGGSIPAHGYFLVQFGSGATGTPLPTPDVAHSFNLSPTSFKLALVANQTTLGGFPCHMEGSSGVVDFVAYVTTECYEGTGPAPLVIASTALLRDDDGCTDTDDNLLDFSVGAPTPRNSASPTHACTVVGACCDLTSCSISTPGSCTGTYQGDFTSCLEVAYAAPAVNAAAYNDISGLPGTVVLSFPSGADDEALLITLPWQFPLYGRPRSQVWVSVNGLLVMPPGTGTAVYDNVAIPNAAAPNDTICPFYDDLRFRWNFPKILTRAETSPDRFVVQWHHLSTYASGTATPDQVNFQLVLFPDGSMSFRYGSIAPTATTVYSATVGVENQAGSAATSVDQALVTGGDTTLDWAPPSYPQIDSDGDGVTNCLDGCPLDPSKIAPGQCGCGIGDTDTDGDGTADCNDLCASDPNKIAPGQCGCGFLDTDTDGDGTADCNDLCASDPNKIAPGICGCGVADVDTDGDGAYDCNELCDDDPLKTDPGQCGCGFLDTDTDGDGTADCNDLCASDPNKTAPGICGCGVSDVDTDGDGTADCNDLCPLDPLKVAPGVCGCGVPDVDSDGDGVLDCDGDKCPFDPNKIAPGQCGCGVLDTDTDGDGVADCNDLCPTDPNKFTPGACGCGVSDTDTDLDGIADCIDNCVAIANPVQEDCDSDGTGDTCELASGSQWDTDDNGIPDQCEGCPAVIPYCTAGTTTNGCSASMSATGNPSVAATSGFVLSTTSLEGLRQTRMFYGITGPAAVQLPGGSTSYFCLTQPFQRTPAGGSGGTDGACDGTWSLDILDYWTTHPGALGTPVPAGLVVNVQTWFRDPDAPATINTSNAIQFTTCP